MDKPKSTTDDTHKGNQVLKREKSVLSQSSQSRKEKHASKGIVPKSEILSSSSKKQLQALPQNVLIDQCFCHYMLRHNIGKAAISDILSKDVHLNITSCITRELFSEIQYQEEALYSFASSVTELSCDNKNCCSKVGACFEQLVQKGNPDCYIVATNSKVVLEKMLKVHGVAVISVSGDSLTFHEPSVSKKYFAEEMTNEGISVAFQSKNDLNKSKKQKKLSYVDDESDTDEAANNNRRVKRKLEKKEVDVNEKKKRVGADRRLKQKLQKKADTKKLSYVDDESDMDEAANNNPLVKRKLEKKEKRSYEDSESEMEEGANNNRRVKKKFEKKEQVDEIEKAVAADHKLKKELVPFEPGCRTVFVGNLNLSIKETDVRTFFRSVARIVEVRISQRENQSARFAHVEFASAEAAREALKLNGRYLLGRAVNLDYANKRLKAWDLASRSNVSQSFHAGRGFHGRFHAGRGHNGGSNAGRGRHTEFHAGRDHRGHHRGFHAGRGRHTGFHAGRGRHGW